jgi:hypothetical protein
MTDPNPPWLTTPEVAKLLHRTPAQLEHWRVTKTGHQISHIITPTGEVLYHEDDVYHYLSVIQIIGDMTPEEYEARRGRR